MPGFCFDEIDFFNLKMWERPRHYFCGQLLSFPSGCSLSVSTY